MARLPLTIVAFTGLLVAASAEAQSRKSPWEVTFFPAGTLIATEGEGAATAALGDYALGGSLSYTFSRLFAVEGELSGGLGLDQDMTFVGGAQRRAKSPSTFLYNANLVAHLRERGRAVVPYLTGGLGGVTLFSSSELGLAGDDQYLAGNFGGGLKFSFGRWGVRSDYRLFAVDGTSDAPAFVGSDARYAHRVYGGLTVDFGAPAVAHGSRQPQGRWARAARRPSCRAGN